MSSDNYLKFGELSLYRLGSDLASASKDLIDGAADGIFINTSGDYKFDNLNCLQQLPKFKALAMVGELSDTTIISSMTWLEHLSTEPAKVKNPSLNALVNLKSLSITLGPELQLPCVYLPSLKTLRVWSLKDKNLDCLKFFPDIEDLIVIQASHLENLHGLRHCLKLRKVDIGYCPKLENTSGLLSCVNLIEVELTNLKRIKSLDSIYQLTKLQRLIVKNVPSVKNISGMTKLKSLQHLAWIETEIEDGDLSPLLEMPNLAHCHVRPNKKHYQPTATYLYDTIKARSLLKDY